MSAKDMIICHAKRFVVLAPWKTASQTMHHRLQRYNESLYPQFFYFNHYLNRVVHQHITCAEFLCLPESKLGYYVASFVRNPYDRVYSGFRQLQEDVKHQPFAQYPETWIRDLVMRQLADNFAQLCQANFLFDAWLALVADEQVYEVGRNSNFPLHPAHYWTHVADHRTVDFVGKVEKFDNDFEKLRSQIDIDKVESGNANVVDMEGRKSENLFGYRYVHLMSPDFIIKINRLFFRDFERFGYEQIV